MTSSVDSIRPEGARAGVRTPTGTEPPSSSMNPSEISPPGSHTQVPGASVEQRTLESRPGPAAEPTLASWNTKRAQEDFQRAMEFVVDRDFSLGRFSVEQWAFLGRMLITGLLYR